MRSNRSPTVRSFQFDVNAPPTSGGVMSPPSSAGAVAAGARLQVRRLSAAWSARRCRRRPTPTGRRLARAQRGQATRPARPRRPSLRASLTACRSCRRRRPGSAEGDVLARVVAAADGDHDVLAAVRRDRSSAIRSPAPASTRRPLPCRSACRRRASSRRADARGVVVTSGSPAMTSVFVTSTPTLPPWPVFGMVSPFSFGMVAHDVRRVAVRHLPLQRRPAAGRWPTSRRRAA